MATFFGRAAHLVKRMFSLLYVYLHFWLFSILVSMARLFLIHQFLVIAYLLHYYNVENHIALSEHVMVHIHFLKKNI